MSKGDTTKDTGVPGNSGASLPEEIGLLGATCGKLAKKDRLGVGSKAIARVSNTTGNHDRMRSLMLIANLAQIPIRDSASSVGTVSRA